MKLISYMKDFNYYFQEFKSSLIHMNKIIYADNLMESVNIMEVSTIHMYLHKSP